MLYILVGAVGLIFYGIGAAITGMLLLGAIHLLLKVLAR